MARVLLLVILLGLLLTTTPASAHSLTTPRMPARTSADAIFSIQAEEPSPLKELRFEVPADFKVERISIESPWTWRGTPEGFVLSGGLVPQFNYLVFTLTAFHPNVGTVFLPYTAVYADGMEREHFGRSDLGPFPAAKVEVVMPNAFEPISDSVRRAEAEGGLSNETLVALGVVAVVGAIAYRFVFRPRR